MTIAIGTSNPATVTRSRLRLPKFGLALPAMLWWIVFFVVPVVLVIAASFGSKVPNSAGRVSYSELSMDNWCIMKGAANIDAAYNFMNYILDPAVSAKEIAFHGYNTGVLGSREQLPADTQFLDMVYFTDEELSRMRAGSLDNQDAVVGIYNKVKAAAGA